MPIVALMPTAARLAWMIGAMAIIAGKEEAMVIDVSNPSGWPASASSFLAFSTSPLRLEEVDAGIAPVPFGITPPQNRRRLAEERAGDDGLAVEGMADRLTDLGIVERLVLCCWAAASNSASPRAPGPQDPDCRDRRPVLGRNLVGEVDLARHDRVGQRRDVRNDDAIFHRVEIRLARLEVSPGCART